MLATKKGHIVTIASVVGFYGSCGISAYSASKFAALGLDESLRAELTVCYDEKDVKITTVAPWIIGDTLLFRGTKLGGFAPLKVTDLAQRILLGVQTNEDMVIVPWHIRYLAVIK